MSANLRGMWALMRRALNEIIRVPGAAIPGVLAPTIFMLGTTMVFGKATRLPGYGTDDFLTFVVPVGLLQGAAFTGAATGVNLARDIEGGWFDRLLLVPLARPAVLGGIVLSACLRAWIPATFLLIVAFSLGAHWPGVDGIVLAYLMVAGMAAIAACWGTTIALKFRSQQAAPLMQAGTFIMVLFTSAYAPRALLADWLRTIADINPVTHVMEGVRHGFVGDGITWHGTWPALVSVTGLTLAFGLLAVAGMSRTGN